MRILALLALAFANGASAIPADAQDRTKDREACVPDYKKHCSGVAMGGGRIKKCLNDNLDKLTPECRAVVEARNATAKAKN